MQVTVRFFASLREKVGRESEQLDISEGQTIADVWNSVCGSIEKPANLLCALNMEYTDWNTPVQANDEVAFFPPVTGGAR